MPYKFKDLIITVDDGCGSTGHTRVVCGSTGDTRKITCGSTGAPKKLACGSTGPGITCLDSAEVLTQAPYHEIDPYYQLELREILLYALTKSKVAVPRPTRLDVLETQMTPNTLEEIAGLERRLNGALKELKVLKGKLKARHRRSRR
jgi:hypothetical protein